MGRNLLARLLIIFQRADHTFYIVCVDRLRRFWIDRPQTLMQDFCPLFGCQAFHLLPKLRIFVDLGEINIIEQCLNIKAGSTRHDRNFSAAVNIFRRRAGKRLKPHDIEILSRL